MLAGFVLSVGPALAYFAAHGLLGDMLHGGLVRPFTGYLPTAAVPFSVPLEWWKLGALEGEPAQPYFPLHYTEMIYFDLLPWPGWKHGWWLVGEVFSRLLYTSVPVAFALLAWLWFRARRQPAASDREREARRRCFAFGLLAFAVTASAFPRADFPHIINVYPVVLLLLFAVSSPRSLGLGGGGDGQSRAGLALGAALVVAWLLVTTGMAARVNAERTVGASTS